MPLGSSKLAVFEQEGRVARAAVAENWELQIDSLAVSNVAQPLCLLMDGRLRRRENPQRWLCPHDELFAEGTPPAGGARTHLKGIVGTAL